METGHASRLAAEQEQLADRMEEMAASGLRRMEVIEQRQNSRSAVVSGIAVIEDERPAQMQIRVSGLLAELGAPALSVRRLGKTPFYVVTPALEHEVHGLYSLSRTEAFCRRGIRFAALLTGEQQADHRMLAPLKFKRKAEGCTRVRLRNGRLLYEDVRGRFCSLSAAQVGKTRDGDAGLPG